MLESGGAFPRRLHVRVDGVELLLPVAPTVREPVADVDFANLDHGTAHWIKTNCLGGLSNHLATSELQVIGTSIRYGGTARMHDLPRYGVLYKRNRVHQTQNVVVVDASCFTTCVEKNPPLTAAAIPTGAADKLAADGRCC
jgi:hypothetical protein